LSSKFYDDVNQDFEVSGPYGRGLITENQGTYLVFAAGTGILCFVDFVISMVF